ncbi:unnamed protein product [Didymodactylos carnosus]|uniref:Uncharacterized protein n=1 Tax=Didymodactylos carnosus TaxID=1234261 RepID=A0A815LSV5_9BILA|nr:unnamed protein product [Didymodactylos carnosus]CAF4300994.1 unnamed protein product [Didymodactylos carnosus]
MEIVTISKTIEPGKKNIITFEPKCEIDQDDAKVEEINNNPSQSLRGGGDLFDICCIACTACCVCEAIECAECCEDCC